MIQQLQSDPAPAVRAQAVHMTGHILSTFFDFIPVRVSQIFVSTLVSSLSKDKSSVDVRCAVMQAIGKILFNPLSHPLLKQMLPELSLSIHDGSEKVRANFVKLLLSIKSRKGLKFYEVVDIDHLLAQLEIEKASKISTQLTELIVDSYFPYAEKSSKQLIRRCAHLVQANPNAAKKFYEMVVKFVRVRPSQLFLHLQVPPGPVTKFIARLWTSCLSKWIITFKASREMCDECQSYSEEEVSDNDRKRRKTSTSCLSTSDFSSVSTLFNIMALCWEGIYTNLQQKDNKPLRTVVSFYFLG